MHFFFEEGGPTPLKTGPKQKTAPTPKLLNHRGGRPPKMSPRGARPGAGWVSIEKATRVHRVSVRQTGMCRLC
jgi:hypothetical protein